jgi:hypothetical protein
MAKTFKYVAICVAIMVLCSLVQHASGFDFTGAGLFLCGTVCGRMRAEAEARRG